VSDVSLNSRRTPVFDAALDRAVTIPSAVIRAHVVSLRRKNPEASPTRIIHLLSQEYTLLLEGAGGAVGAAAAFPAVGTGVSLALSTGDVATFFASSSAYALCVAEVHGIQADDVERRRALLLATVLGESGAKSIADVSGKSMSAWGTALLTTMPKSTIRQVNSVLTRRFVKRRIATQSSLAIGRVIPFGIGAVIGVAGGRSLARTVTHQARRAFGEPLAHFPRPTTPTSPTSAPSKQPVGQLSSPSGDQVAAGPAEARGNVPLLDTLQ
jgi:hypothetical protein